MINVIEKSSVTEEKYIKALSKLITLLRKVNKHRNVLKLLAVLRDQTNFYLVFEAAGFTTIGSIVDQRGRYANEFVIK